MPVRVSFFLDGKVVNLVYIILSMLVLAQSGICRFEFIQPVSAWLIKAERVGAGPSQDGQA